MERHRDIRRGNMAAAAAANGLSRRRQRSSASATTSNSFRDSPEHDGTGELQETRLRDRVDRAGKKERDRLNRNKRRRGERLMLGGHRDDGGDDSTEDSIDDDDDDEEDESSHIRMRPPNPASSSAHSNHHLHRKSFPPAAAKVVRTTTWKVSDEMSFIVPKKARSACTKRAHETYVSVVGGSGGGGVGGGSGEQVHRQASTSPARPSPAPTPAPASPSSSTASVRKKLKPIGAKPKHKPPKPSGVQDDIEIEVAEVLYGLLRQSQCPSRQEAATNCSSRHDSRDANGSGNDASPSLSKLPQNCSSTTTPVSAVAPKRKRPRPVKFEDEHSPNFANKNDSMSSNKIEDEQPTKTEVSSTKLDSGSNESPNGISLDFGSSQAAEVPLDGQQELKTESNSITEPKAVAEESIVRADDQNNDITTSLKKESSCPKAEIDSKNATTTNASSASVVSSRREENFKIDLMAPPSKSSPERDGEIGPASDSKPVASDIDMKIDHRELKEKENVVINSNQDNETVAPSEKKKEEASVEEFASQKESAAKHTMVDPQIDPKKDNNNDCGPNNVRQQQLHTQQQHQSKTTRNEPKLEIAAQSISSVPLPMNITGWPSGLTPMGNGMGQVQFQGMTSLDGTPGSSNTIQPPHQLTQPRPKRCATHYYIARNIYYHQQFTKMNPFWPAAAAGAAASLYGNKPYNLNVMPPTEAAIIGNPLLGNFAGKSLSSMQDRGQVEGTKDKSSVATNSVDATQGKIPKQMVLQQPPQQAVIQGPAFIFPPNHQQAVVSSGSKNGVANMSNTNNAAPSPAVQSTPGSTGNSSASAAGSAAISYSYPNMGSEAQYVAILQNNGYTFPVPPHVGPSSSFRGTAPPAMPFYNGPVYSSQVMHPAQLQQQQQQQLQQHQMQQHQMQQSHSQQQPSQQGHQNTSTSSGSSSSQKHQQQNQQQRLQGSGSNAAANGTSNSIAASKNRPQKQQSQPFPLANQVRQHESDMAFEDSSTAEANRNSQAHKNTYSHNFAMPMQAKNYASLSSAGLANGGNGYHNERPHQQQHQGSKGGTESGPNQTFAMPYSSFNGGTAISGLDFSSIAQNHVIFQSLPEAARHGYQVVAAAAAQTAQQKKNNQTLEEGKAVSDSNNAEEERKATAGKGQPSSAQAIVFSRTDPTDPSASTILGNSVVESSARTLNLISSPGNGNRSSRANTSTAAAPTSTMVTASYSQQQQHQQQQHLQQKQMGQFMQMQQLQQMQIMRQQQMHQQIAAAAAARGKPPSTTSGVSVYTDSLPSSSSMAAKFTNTQYFPESLIQGGSSNQSPQWKNTRPAVSASSSPSLASAASLKTLSQQQGRTQQGHTQISFGVNSKQGNVQQGQQISAGNQSPSSPVVVGSPPTSISKSAGGSPRASSMGNKLVSTPSLSSQQPKTSSSGPSRKSSPVGGRNAPSNLGNSNINPAPCSTAKTSQSHHQQTLQQQQQQQQQQKHALQQAQLYFSNAHMQAQSPQSNSSTGNSAVVLNNVYYQQRRQPPEQQQQQQQQLGSSNTSSGMLSLCPLTLASSTSDPTKAVAAANMKGGLPPPGLIQAAQFANQSGGHPFMSTTFPYIHSVPSAQVKPAEQKQPAGNDNLHAYSQPEKR